MPRPFVGVGGGRRAGSLSRACAGSSAVPMGLCWYCRNRLAGLGEVLGAVAVGVDLVEEPAASLAVGAGLADVGAAVEPVGFAPGAALGAADGDDAAGAVHAQARDQVGD